MVASPRHPGLHLGSLLHKGVLMQPFPGELSSRYRCLPRRTQQPRGRDKTRYDTASPSTPKRREWRGRTFAASPSTTRGAAVEFHYWDRNRKLKLRLQLRRFEICLVLILVFTLLLSAFGDRLRLSDLQVIISFARAVFST